VHPNILEASLCLHENAATILQACQLIERIPRTEWIKCFGM